MHARAAPAQGRAHQACDKPAQIAAGAIPHKDNPKTAILAPAHFNGDHASHGLNDYATAFGGSERPAQPQAERGGILYLCHDT